LEGIAVENLLHGALLDFDDFLAESPKDRLFFALHCSTPCSTLALRLLDVRWLLGGKRCVVTQSIWHLKDPGKWVGTAIASAVATDSQSHHR